MKKMKIKNTVVVSGLMLKDYNLKTTGEFDFIIISSSSRSIIQIEAKRGNNEKNRQHANQQLYRGQKFFEDNFPFPSSENWKLIKLMCFGDSVQKDICEECKPYILGSDFIRENTIQSIRNEIANQFQSFLETLSDGKNAGKFLIFMNKLYSISNKIKNKF
jgi:hypothetical protein